MIEIIRALQQNHYYGAGELTEIAKGKHELNYSWSAVKTKAKRVWQSSKK